MDQTSWNTKAGMNTKQKCGLNKPRPPKLDLPPNTIAEFSKKMPSENQICNGEQMIDEKKRCYCFNR